MLLSYKLSEQPPQHPFRFGVPQGGKSKVGETTGGRGWGQGPQEATSDPVFYRLSVPILPNCPVRGEKHPPHDLSADCGPGRTGSPAAGLKRTLRGQSLHNAPAPKAGKTNSKHPPYRAHLSNPSPSLQDNLFLGRTRTWTLGLGRVVPS